MREELVRTDEEKQHYRQLVESNRQRRQEGFHMQERLAYNRHQSIAQVKYFVQHERFDDCCPCLIFIDLSRWCRPMLNVYIQVIGYFFRILFMPTIISA
jgi:hypothetical protein